MGIYNSLRFTGVQTSADGQFIYYYKSRCEYKFNTSAKTTVLYILYTMNR